VKNYFSKVTVDGIIAVMFVAVVAAMALDLI